MEAGSISRKVWGDSGVEIMTLGGTAVHVGLALIFSNARRSLSRWHASWVSIPRPIEQAGVSGGVAGKIFGIVCRRWIEGVDGGVVVVARRSGMDMI